MPVCVCVLWEQKVFSLRELCYKFLRLIFRHELHAPALRIRHVYIRLSCDENSISWHFLANKKSSEVVDIYMAPWLGNSQILFMLLIF